MTDPIETALSSIVVIAIGTIAALMATAAWSIMRNSESRDRALIHVFTGCFIVGGLAALYVIGRLVISLARLVLPIPEGFP